MDLQHLLQSGVVTQSTKDWLEPLLQKERENAKEIKESAVDNQLFARPEDDDEGDDEDDNDMVETSSISLYGITLEFFRDGQSTGHGNRVWHASIATCMYLRYLWLQDNVVPSLTDATSSTSIQASTLPPLRVLEFGAGTALPSLFIVNLLANTVAQDSASNYKRACNKPVVHITDGKQYRNIRQILLSLDRQPQHVMQNVHIRVSPHNWGEGIDISSQGTAGMDSSFFEFECPSSNQIQQQTTKNEEISTASNSAANSYDWIIVSDCIYNPNYHESLLQSIASCLTFPTVPATTTTGGRAIVTFSLHGNTSDDTIWEFFNKVRNIQRCDQGREWQLKARPIRELPNAQTSEENAIPMPTMDLESGGWHMEETMKFLDLWAANVEPKRWLAYVYEILWIER